MATPVKTAFTGANGLVLLSKRARNDLADYIEAFIRHKNPKLSAYISDELIGKILPATESAEVIKGELDKIVEFEMTTTKTALVYQLDVTYEKRGAESINNLLRVVCLRKGVDLTPRGKREPNGYRYSVLIDIATGGNITDGVARLARLVYYLNQI